MNIDAKRELLEAIYRLYDDTVAPLPAACQKGCAHCCTRNVTLTTLEAYRMVAGLNREALERLYQNLGPAAGRDRFRPQITVNHLAELAMGDAEPPEEECDPAWTPCPLLAGELCPLYDLRPFACRSMASSTVCRPGGWAAMDDYRITVNTVFQQVIEHLDVPGATGNLIDVLFLFNDPQACSVYRSQMLQPGASGLPANRPVKMLMILPEHQVQLRPVVARLQALMAR